MKDYFQSRREFLRVLPGLTLTAMCWTSCSDDSDSVGPVDEPRPARAGIANPFVNQDGQPLLVCIEGDDFDAMLEEGLSRLGGLETLISTDQSVLIKPNCNYRDTYPGVSSADCVAGLVAAALQVSNGTIKVGDQG